MSDPKPTGLALLRVPFPEHHISKLPKESSKQIDERKNRVQGCMVWECKICGGAHHKDAVHLDYVGHAAATDRLLDADMHWTWEPVADPAALGFPVAPGGMWIKLTVDGVSRYGFGCADGKTGGDAIKEIIGDAIRNAGMRFGMALDLWHKGNLRLEDDDEASGTTQETAPQQKQEEARITKAQWAKIVDLIKHTESDAAKVMKTYGVTDLKQISAADAEECISRLESILADMAKQDSNKSLADELDDDSIPY